MNCPEQNRLNSATEKSHQDLLPKVVAGGFWVFFLRILQQSLAISKLIVITHFIRPEEVGLMAVSVLSIDLLARLTDTGFHSALIQRKDYAEDHLNTAWTFGIVRAGVIFITLFFLSDSIAAYFNCPKASAIIKCIAILFLINSCNNIGMIHFQKDLRFKKHFLCQLAGIVANFCATILFAVLYRNVWALVLGRLTESLVNFIISYMAHPFRPKLQWNNSKLKELWSFGKWIFALAIISFAAQQGVDIFVGKYLGLAMLAFYLMAYKMATLPTSEISYGINQIIFPAYSKLQDDIPRLKDAYLKVLLSITFFTFPVAGLIFILGPDFVWLFMDEKWAPIAPVLQILALLGLIRSMGTTRPPLFQAIGKPGINTRIQIMRVTSIVLLIYPFALLWGIKGVAICVLLCGLLFQPFGMYLAAKYIQCRFMELVKPILPSFLATFFMVLFLWMSHSYIGQTSTNSSYSLFLLHILLGLSLYLATCLLFDKLFCCGIKGLLQEQIAALKRKRHTSSNQVVL